LKKVNIKHFTKIRISRYFTEIPWLLYVYFSLSSRILHFLGGQIFHFNFFVFLFFSILGMNIFGCKFYYESSGGKKEFDRKNFDSLLWALVTVFQVSMVSPKVCGLDDVISALRKDRLYNVSAKNRLWYRCKNKSYSVKIFSIFLKFVMFFASLPNLSKTRWNKYQWHCFKISFKLILPTSNLNLVFIVTR